MKNQIVLTESDEIAVKFASCFGENSLSKDNVYELIDGEQNTVFVLSQKRFKFSRKVVSKDLIVILSDVEYELEKETIEFWKNLIVQSEKVIIVPHALQHTRSFDSILSLTISIKPSISIEMCNWNPLEKQFNFPQSFNAASLQLNMTMTEKILNLETSLSNIFHAFVSKHMRNPNRTDIKVFDIELSLRLKEILDKMETEKVISMGISLTLEGQEFNSCATGTTQDMNKMLEEIKDNSAVISSITYDVLEKKPSKPYNFIGIFVKILSVENDSSECFSAIVKLFTKGLISNPFVYSTTYSGDITTMTEILRNFTAETDICEFNDFNFKLNGKESAIYPVNHSHETDLSELEKKILMIIIEGFLSSTKVPAYTTVRKTIVTIKNNQFEFVGPVQASTLQLGDDKGSNWQAKLEERSTSTEKDISVLLKNAAIFLRWGFFVFEDFAELSLSLKKLYFNMENGKVFPKCRIACVMPTWIWLLGFDTRVFSQMERKLTQNDIEKPLSKMLKIMSTDEKAEERTMILNRFKSFNLEMLKEEDEKLRDQNVRGNLLVFGINIFATKNLNASTISKTSSSDFNSSGSPPTTPSSAVVQAEHSKTLNDINPKRMKQADYLMDLRSSAMNNQISVIKFGANEHDSEASHVIINLNKLKPEFLPTLTCRYCKNVMSKLVVHRDGPRKNLLFYRCNNDSCRNKASAFMYAQDIFGSLVKIPRNLLTSHLR